MTPRTRSRTAAAPTDLLVISGYATAGLAVTYLVMFLIGRPLMTA